MTDAVMCLGLSLGSVASVLPIPLPFWLKCQAPAACCLLLLVFTLHLRDLDTPALALPLSLWHDSASDEDDSRLLASSVMSFSAACFAGPGVSHLPQHVWTPRLSPVPSHSGVLSPVPSHSGVASPVLSPCDGPQTQTARRDSIPRGTRRPSVSFHLDPTAASDDADTPEAQGDLMAMQPLPSEYPQNEGM
uniref:Uncharacterized protein n=1 Tax=Eutreptiella gymnastica TaxID=73025 RepID=A0A7S4CSX4_9EUGL